MNQLSSSSYFLFNAFYFFFIFFRQLPFLYAKPSHVLCLSPAQVYLYLIYQFKPHLFAICPSQPYTFFHSHYSYNLNHSLKHSPGIAGLTVGSIAGVLRGTTPVLFSIVSGLQWTALGGTYWGIRSAILQRDGVLNYWALTRGLPLKPRNDYNPTPSDRVYASTVAGGLSAGIWGWIFRA